MKTALRTFGIFGLVVMLACVSFAATPVFIESAHVHSAVGAFGCSVTGVSTANPGVVTCGAAHGLVTGDTVQITGVVGATQANVMAVATVTDSTHFSIPVNVTGTYSSGGAVSIVTDVSSYGSISGPQDFTLRLQIDSLTAAKSALVCIQDSADGFVSDIVTLACVNVSGPVQSAAPTAFTWRQYQLPTARMGVLNARLRLYVMSLNVGATVTTSLVFEQ
jgi:hypothetical protein